MSDEETTVVVDINEPESIRVLALYHPDTDNWVEHQLDAADIVVNGVGIERKRPSDFASSMLEDRLDEQVRKLNDAFDSAVILIEGGFDDFSDLEHTRLKAQSARGKAASIHMRHGIPVVPTGGTPNTERAERLLVDYAIRLGRKATEEPTSGYLPSSVVGSNEPLGKRLWGVFEGVGPSRAGALYESLGTPMRFYFLAMSVESGGLHPTAMDDLIKVDGIGAKTAQGLVEQLEGKEDLSPSVDVESAQDDRVDGQNGNNGS